MYAYCNNNPVVFSDSSGCYIDFGYDPEIGPPLGWGYAGLGGSAAGVSTAGAGSGSVSAADAVAAVVVGVGAVIASTKKPSDPYTVYFLCAAEDSSETIIYVGRVKTANYSKRMNYHKSVGRKLVGKIDGLSYEVCRAIEQGGMMYYHTINQNNKINNQIRGVGHRNSARSAYINAAVKLVEDGLYPNNMLLPASYWANMTEEAFLNGSP